MNSSNKYISCVTVEDYVNGSYSFLSVNNSLTLSSDTATITTVDGESLSVSSYNLTAKTDGYDIYQTATIIYVDESQVNRTLIIEYKNQDVINSTLDGGQITFVKN